MPCEHEHNCEHDHGDRGGPDDQADGAEKHGYGFIFHGFVPFLQYIVNISRGNKKNSESNIAININDIAL